MANRFNWQNVSGSSSYPRCRCNTWKDHWGKYSQLPWPNSCSVDGCLNKAVCGAHVEHHEISNEYIIPMCGEHNCHTSENLFDLKQERRLVLADTANTCSRRFSKLLNLIAPFYIDVD